MPKKKRKPYTKSEKWSKSRDQMTDWSKRAAVYSLKNDQKKSVKEIAGIYNLSTQRVYGILKQCEVKMQPE
jgi:hypothetical protein